MRTLHEHEYIRRVELARAILRDRELDRTERLADRERDPVGVIRRDLRRIRLHLRVERRSTRKRVRVVIQERTQLPPKSATHSPASARKRRMHTRSVTDENSLQKYKLRN